MIRNVIGGILAAAGAAAAVLSPYHVWYDGRDGRDYRVRELFGTLSAARPGVWTSLLLPFAVAALITLVGVVLRSRGLVTLAGLVVIGFTVLWMVRQGQAAHGLAIQPEGPSLGQGVAYAAGGGIVLLLGAVVMRGRRRRAPLEAPREPSGWYDGPED
jgi:hypothetical protein